MSAELWHYERNDGAAGPVTPSEIIGLISDGAIRAETLVWRRGLAGWEAATKHFDFGAGPTRAVPSARFETDAPGQGMSDRARRYMLRRGAEPQPVSPVPGGYMPRTAGLYHLAPARGFPEAVAVCLRKYFVFSGRASRSEYWYFVLFTFLLGLFAGILDFMMFGAIGKGQNAGPINAAASLLLLIPSLAVLWRRLHDTGRSGWWIGGFWLAGIAIVAVMVLSLVSAPVAQGLAGNLLALTVVAGLASVLYSIALLVMLCGRGDQGPNRFG